MIKLVFAVGYLLLFMLLLVLGRLLGDDDRNAGYNDDW